MDFFFFASQNKCLDWQDMGNSIRISLREEGNPPIHSCLKGKMLGMGSNADTSEGVSGGDPTHTSSF